jgi:predicted unusual protein kinase regulating ubiquinone biosynthesis (AarF/ABC1/UbiB family)
MWFILPFFIIDYIKYKIGWTDYNSSVKKICLDLAQYNILYVKCFQWFTNDNDNIELSNFFQTFKDNVPYTEADIDWVTIKSINLDNISEVPINSGTIALIFKGTCYGNPVVIKVLRKNIIPKVNQMFNHLTFLKHVVSYFYGNIEFPPKSYFIDQMDFRKEVENMEMFRCKFKKNKNIIIPKVYREYTTLNENVIVMDHLASYKEKDQWTFEEHKIYNQIFTRFLVSSYFIKDIYHADLHRGNIIFMRHMDEYKIGLIDFGVIGFLTIENQNFIYDLFDILSKNDYRQLANRFAEQYSALPEQIKNITNAFCTAFEKNKCTDMEQFRHVHLKLIFQVLRQFNLKIDDNMNTYLFSILSIISTMRILTTPDEDNTLKNIFLKFKT